MDFSEQGSLSAGRLRSGALQPRAAHPGAGAGKTQPWARCQGRLWGELTSRHFLLGQDCSVTGSICVRSVVPLDILVARLVAVGSHPPSAGWKMVVALGAQFTWKRLFLPLGGGAMKSRPRLDSQEHPHVFFQQPRLGRGWPRHFPPTPPTPLLPCCHLAPPTECHHAPQSSPGPESSQA